MLCFSDGTAIRLKVRSLVGLLPRAATAVNSSSSAHESLPELTTEARFLPDLYRPVTARIGVPDQPGIEDEGVLMEKWMSCSLII